MTICTRLHGTKSKERYLNFTYCWMLKLNCLYKATKLQLTFCLPIAGGRGRHQFMSFPRAILWSECKLPWSEFELCYLLGQPQLSEKDSSKFITLCVGKKYIYQINQSEIGTSCIHYLNQPIRNWHFLQTVFKPANQKMTFLAKSLSVCSWEFRL